MVRQSGLAGAGNLPPSAPASPDPYVYTCDCEGFRKNWPEKFCLRCLDTWAAGLPAHFKGKHLLREMRRAAAILARHLKDDPTLGRLSVRSALEASETFPRRN